MRIRTLLLSFALVALVAASAFAASGTAAPQSTPDLQKALTSGKKTIVFFINPNGKPCSMQKEIITKLLGDRKGNFNVVYVSTLNPDDEKAFYDYGIRNLPSLVLVDTKGMISKVFPPGIQSAETLQQTLDSIK